MNVLVSVVTYDASRGIKNYALESRSVSIDLFVQIPRNDNKLNHRPSLVNVCEWKQKKKTEKNWKKSTNEKRFEKRFVLNISHGNLVNS